MNYELYQAPSQFTPEQIAKAEGELLPFAKLSLSRDEGGMFARRRAGRPRSQGSRVNQDFREVTKMFDRSCVEIEIYEFESGPFSERDIRVKNRYVAQ